MASRPKVLVTRNDIPQEAITILMQKCDVEIHEGVLPISREDLLKKIADKDALFCILTDKIDAEVLDAAGPQLKIIGTMSVGFDHLSMSDIKSRDIKVGNTPDVLTDATSELTIALLLATSRRLFEANKALKMGEWQCAWSPMWMTGWSISGSTIGIFGLGRVGQGVMKRLMNFNVKKFLYAGRHRKKEADVFSAEFVSFEELLTQSDFIIVCAALNDETKGLFDRSAFCKMKKSAVFINTARGGLVVQEDLTKALENGDIAAAGLDVMTPEPLPPSSHPHLLSTRNLTILPHIGSADVKTRIAMATLTAENIIAGLDGRDMPAPLC